MGGIEKRIVLLRVKEKGGGCVMDRQSKTTLYSKGLAYGSCGKHAERQRFGVDIRSGLPRRATAMAAAVVISAALMCPNLAFAADWVNVDGM